MPRVFEGNLLHRRSLCRHHATLLPQEAGGGGAVLRDDKENGGGVYFKITVLALTAIGHLRVPPGLCFQTRLSAQPLIWK